MKWTFFLNSVLYVHVNMFVSVVYGTFLVRVVCISWCICGLHMCVVHACCGDGCRCVHDMCMCCVHIL